MKKVISLYESDKKYMENITIFGIKGDVSIPMYDEDYVSHVNFISQEQYDDETYIDVLKKVEKIYGDHKGVDNLKYDHELQSIFEWDASGNIECDIRCQRDENNIVTITWIEKGWKNK